MIYDYLDCGDLHMGFARVKCADCHHEYLLPFSCKKRCLCPSCHQRRVVEFGEALVEDILQPVRHRQWVFSIPKRLRYIFAYDRKLLGKLSRCAWDVLSRYLRHESALMVLSDNTTGTRFLNSCTLNERHDKALKKVMDSLYPGAVIAVQTYGEHINFNPHLHIIATDGCFDSDGNFIQTNFPQAADLESLFQHSVFHMLKKEGKITADVIENMLTWQHSGFHVYCGDPVGMHDRENMERLGQYIVRAPASNDRMVYIPQGTSPGAPNGAAKVIYKGKTSHTQKVFSALEWLASLVSHIPNKGEQLVRYYGTYSNKSRGLRKKLQAEDANSNTAHDTSHAHDTNPAQAESSEDPSSADTSQTSADTSQIPITMQINVPRRKIRKSWARLIAKVYLTDPLQCPKCSGKMRIISFIEEEAVIKKILVHLDLWENEDHSTSVSGNHDPPVYAQFMLSELLPEDSIHLHNNDENERVTVAQSSPDYADSSYQAGYEDEYSQWNPYNVSCNIHLTFDRANIERSNDICDSQM